MRLSFVIASALAATAAACAQSDSAVMQQGGATDVAAVRSAVDAANATFAEAIQRGDSLTLASLYDVDAMVMPQGMNASTGRAAIQSMFAGLLSQFTVSNMTLVTQDVVASGDLAVETGRYSWTLTPKNGKAMPDSGKYVVVWRKQADGSWKLYRDIFNNDAPPPAPTMKK